MTDAPPVSSRPTLPSIRESLRLSALTIKFRRITRNASVTLYATILMLLYVTLIPHNYHELVTIRNSS